jgi:hypothetical protein
VPIQTSPTFIAGAPKKLFDGPYIGNAYWRTFDVAADGRFLMIRDNAAGERQTRANIVVVMNWLEELKGHLMKQ